MLHALTAMWGIVGSISYHYLIPADAFVSSNKLVKCVYMTKQHYIWLVRVKASMQQRKMDDVKHSSLSEQSVNVYKGSEHPGVLHQLSKQPDVKE